MFKKTDSANFTIADASGYNLHYTPSEIIKNAKIYRGVLTIPISLFATTTTFDVKINDEIIDRIDINLSKSYVCIDITDELQDLFNKENGETLSILFVGNNLTSANNIECKIEYDPQTVNNSGNLVKNINVKRAGSGAISLFNKNFTFSHEDIKTNSKVLPFNIKHTYSKFNKDNSFVLLRNGSHFELPKSFCGKGWKLNYQQFLVKENHSELVDNETSNSYTYIDDMGNQIVFQEKFYYYDNEDQDKEHKIYVLASDVEISQDGTLTYTASSDDKFEVFTEINSNSDYVLETKGERFKEIEYIQQDVEDVANLKSQIEDLQITLEDCKNSKIYNSQQNLILNKSNLISKIQEKMQRISNFSDNRSIKLSIDNKSDQKSYDDYYKLYLDEVDTNDNKKLANTYQDSIASRNNEFQWQGDSKVDNVNSINDLEAEMNENLDLESIEAKVENCSFETMGSVYRNKLSAVLSNYLIIVNQSYTEAQTALQTEQLENELAKLEKLIKNYEIKLTQYLYQLHELEKQIPEYYLTDKQGKSFMGFAKFKEDSLYSANENVEKSVDIYRLVAIADSYENTIVINYDDSKNECKISSIVDADNNAVVFNYNENGLLENIVDDRENKVSFYFDENELLKSIQYMDDTKSLYEYNSNNLLSKIIDNSGYGIQITYLYNEINVEELATYSLIRDKQKPILCKSGNVNTPRVKQLLNVKYYDYRTTIVTDAKDNVETYLFDSKGNPTTIYSGSFDENKVDVKNTSAISYQFNNNKITEKSSKLKNSKNIFKVYSENYLGDEIYLGDEVYPTLYELPKDNEIYTISSSDTNKKYEISINNSQLQLLNYGTRCHILSAWVKADSAYVLGADDDNLNDIDNLIRENISTYRANRKFELRAELSIKKGDVVTTKTFARSFDWMQTNWQYCELPIYLEEDETVTDGHLYFDYTNNTNDVKMYGFSLNEGTYEKTEYNTDGLAIRQENFAQHTVVTIEYDDDNLPIKQTLTYKNKDYVTTYTYNKNKDLIRTVNYNGMVEEKEYNDQGQVIKTSKYNLSDPSSKYITKTKLNDKGEETGSIDEFGDDDCEYEYLGKTGNISSIKDRNGHKTSYGYNPMTEELISMSTSAGGEENSNIYGYTLGLLTRLSHNDFDFKFEYDGFGRQTAIQIDGQDASYVKNQYLENSVLNTYSNGDVVETVKDSKDNVTKVNYTPAENGSTIELIKNTYDENDNLVKQEECIERTENEQTVTEKFVYENQYDSNGNTIYSSKSKVVDNNTTETELEISSSYNEFNNVESAKMTISNPAEDVDDDILTYSYKYDKTPDNRLMSLTLPNGSTQSLEYDCLERVKDIYYDDKFSKHINYVKKGEYCSDLVASVWFGQNGVIKDNTKYLYDEKGNITKIFENGTEKVRYTYDELSRLIREDNKELNKTFIYSYDNGGNIVEKFETVYTLTNSDNIIKETVTTDDIAADKTEYGFSLRKPSKLTKYGYSATGWRDLLLSLNDEKFEYDSLGNPTTYRDTALEWNYLRNLAKFGEIATYKYNASGIRTSKVVDNTETKFYLNGSKVVAQDDGTNRLLFYYGIDGLTGFSLNGTEYVYKKNIQNDIIGIYDANGNQIVKYVYDAWGNHKTFVLYQSNFVDISLENDYNDDNYQGKVQLATLNPFRYRSYYFDEETGLYYLNTRYYDPEIGRFINADSLEILENTKEIINGLNLFAYCLNNPVNTSDGNGDIPNWLKWLIGALIIVTAAVLTVVTAGGFAAAGAAFAGAIGIGATVSGAAGFFASVTVGAVIAGGIGLLAGGISSAVSGGNFWDGAADGFMWGSIGGALSGGYGSFFNNTGLILNSAGKAVGSIPQIIGQSVISVGTYIAQSFANNQTPTFIGIISSIFGATVGGLLAYTTLFTQFIINVLSEGVKVAVDAFKQVISKLFKFDPQNNNWFW